MGLKYRLQNTLDSMVKSKIKKGFYGLQLVKSDGGIVWDTMKPTSKDLKKLKEYNPFEFIDPNELNTKLGLPPYYVIFKEGEDPEEWVRKNFDVETFVRLGRFDIIIEGEYRGTGNIL